MIDNAYNNYVKTSKPTLDGKYISQPEFIFWVKTNDNFSKKCGLKIEEKELSLEERYKLANINGNKENLPGEPRYTEEQQHSMLDELVPTKLITITYNNETIESYE